MLLASYLWSMLKIHNFQAAEGFNNLTVSWWIIAGSRAVETHPVASLRRAHVTCLFGDGGASRPQNLWLGRWYENSWRDWTFPVKAIEERLGAWPSKKPVSVEPVRLASYFKKWYLSLSWFLFAVPATETSPKRQLWGHDRNMDKQWPKTPATFQSRGVTTFERWKLEAFCRDYTSPIRRTRTQRTQGPANLWRLGMGADDVEGLQVCWFQRQELAFGHRLYLSLRGHSL